MAKLNIDLTVIENVIKFCEDKQVYDKLSAYGDFYYKLKQAVRDFDEPKDRDNVREHISLGINIDQETTAFGLSEHEKQIFKAVLYKLHVNGKLKFTPLTEAHNWNEPTFSSSDRIEIKKLVNDNGSKFDTLDEEFKRKLYQKVKGISVDGKEFTEKDFQSFNQMMEYCIRFKGKLLY